MTSEVMAGRRHKRIVPVEYFVMAGLVPAIHALLNHPTDVDARDKPGHDVERSRLEAINTPP
jgi:hypothetical protein